MPLFSSARLKLRYATKLIDDLEASLNAWAAIGPVLSELTGIRPADEHNPEWQEARVVFEPAPEFSPTILGDIVHNMRTALDHLASELARANGESDKGVYFPFAEDVHGLDEQIRNKKFRRCGDDAVRLLRSFKPYRGGNAALRAIHDLDVIDKHRTFLPDPLIDFDEVRAGEAWVTSRTPDGRAAGQMRWTAPEVAGIHFAFTDDTGLDRRPLFETLKELVSLCESIIESFAALKLADEKWVNANGDLLAETEPNKIVYFRFRLQRGLNDNPPG